MWIDFASFLRIFVSELFLVAKVYDTDDTHFLDPLSEPSFWQVQLVVHVYNMRAMFLNSVIFDMASFFLYSSFFLRLF